MDFVPEEYPLIIERKLEQFSFKRPESPKFEKAYVFLGENCQPVVVNAGKNDGPTVGDILTGTYKIYYEVDLSECSIAFSVSIPCADDIPFTVEVILTYCIDNPLLVVQNGRRDIRNFLKESALNIIRPICRNYANEQASQAERAVIEELKNQLIDGDKIHNLGFKLSRSPFVTLSSHESISKRLIDGKLGTIDAKMQSKIIHEQFSVDTIKAEMEKRLMQQRLEIESMRQELLFKDRQIELDRQTILLEQSMNLELKRMEAEMRIKQIEFEKQIEMQRIEFNHRLDREKLLSPLLSIGNWRGIIAICNPENQNDRELLSFVKQQIDREEKMRVEENSTCIEILKIFVEKGVIGEWRFEEIAKSLVQKVGRLSDQGASLIEEKLSNEENQQNQQEGNTDNKIYPEKIMRDGTPE